MAMAPHRIALPVGLTYLRAALPPIADAQYDMIRDGLRAMDDRDRKQAEARDRRAARRQQKQEAAAPVPPPPADALAPDVAKALKILADDPEALEALLPLLGTSGVPARKCQAVPPPSPNGASHKGRPGG
jgi:hypothetical protein